MKKVSTRNFLEAINLKMIKPKTVTLRCSSNDIDTENMEHGKFIESLEYLSKSGIFADYIDWTYEKIHEVDREDYIIVHCKCIYFSIDAKLQICDGVSGEDVEKKFRENFGEYYSR